jgi:hypothetical protein
MLRYLTRPLHFFGSLGMLGIGTGSIVALWMVALKLLTHVHIIDEHGPLVIFAAVLIVAGVQLLALGLLGEMQVRHYHEPVSGVPYRVDKVIRTEQGEESEIHEE